MAGGKVVKDLMVDVFDFPHIPYWFSIRQAMGIIRKSVIESTKCVRPIVILVFDEKYNLVGTLTRINILKGLEPKFLKPVTKAEVHEESEVDLSVIWDNLFSTESKKLAEKPVSEVMVPAKLFVEQDDPITKAAYLMLHNDLVLLPVLENKKKLVGVVRMIEVFDELSNAILSEQ
ncbi:MAG: CBS domain-containing protein [Nitrospirae bacterium]|nr:CBS domain-containing protein [Nitrospirota bacterium]MCL5977466.1 CBS domain-containing protein [Nitrospirota bacterium]